MSPAGKIQASARQLVPAAAESSTPTAARRVRLSKAVAARSAKKSADAGPSKSNGQKRKRPKLVSGRYKLTDGEYAQLSALKARLSLSGTEVRKSELLRAGLLVLAALDDVQLKKTMAKVDVLKPRRRPAIQSG